MTDKELNVLLIQQIKDLEALIASLTAEVSEIHKALAQKDEQTQKLVAKLNALTKISLPKKNESRRREVDPAADKSVSPTPKERGNNGAKRKEYDIQEIVVEVDPQDAEFQKENAKLLFWRETIRYKFIPPQIIKYIYRCNKYSQDDRLFEGIAPASPFLNSNYDGSVIANLLQQRFIYGLPVDRIVRYYHEMGIDMPKATAHGLIAKAAEVLDRLNSTLKKAILSEEYIHFDETFHTVLDKTTEKGSRKAYFWAASAHKSQLFHLFYINGSRSKKVFTDYLPASYQGAIQSDGYSSYKVLEVWDYPHAIRIGCIQHCKRKFFDIESEQEASRIIDLYNRFYQIRQKHPPERWVEESLIVYKELEEFLRAIERDERHHSNAILIKGVAYCLNELESIRMIISSTTYDLDNNRIERPMRYISWSRKNSMFCASNKGAERMATIYSLAISCSLNKVNSFEYFKDVITRLALTPHSASEEKLREFLPDKWADK